MSVAGGLSRGQFPQRRTHQLPLWGRVDEWGGVVQICLLRSLQIYSMGG